MQFSFTEIETFVLVLGALLGFIVLVYNAVKALKAMTQPIKDMSDRLEKVETKLNNDYEVLEHEKELDRLMLRSVRQLVIHEIDGNDVEGMKSLKMEIDDYLIKNA